MVVYAPHLQEQEKKHGRLEGAQGALDIHLNLYKGVQE
jgi:hypothetical protein